MSLIYEKVREFKRKYPATIAWRIKAHSRIAENHLYADEKIIYAFAAQKNDAYSDMFRTFVIVLTNKRILLAQKRLIYGYFLLSITPDLFNDLTVEADLLWGTILIDTVREQVKLTNIQKDALPEIEKNITSYMIKEKQKYQVRQSDNNVNVSDEETTDK